MSDDFFAISRKQGRDQFGISDLDDPNQIVKVFTHMPPQERVAALERLDTHLAGTFERSQTRSVAKHARLRRELLDRHHALLRHSR